jgi:hypothetical protein
MNCAILPIESFSACNSREYVPLGSSVIVEIPLSVVVLC